MGGAGPASTRCSANYSFMISPKLKTAAVGTAALILMLGIGPNTAKSGEQNEHVKTLSGIEITTADRYKLITARMVLDHTSGFPNWRSNNPDRKLDIKFTPGTKYSYSGEGYLYLAKVIAHLTGKDLSNLDGLFQQEVCIPLNLNEARFGTNDYVTKHLATGYDGDKTVSDRSWDRILFNPACGLHTEAVSYAKFLIAVMEDKGLKKESMGEMLKAQVRMPDDANDKKYNGITEWSLGFGRKPSIYGINYTHGGNNRGYTSTFVFNKDKKFGYVFFSNFSQHNPSNELQHSIETFLTNGK